MARKVLPQRIPKDINENRYKAMQENIRERLTRDIEDAERAMNARLYLLRMLHVHGMPKVLDMTGIARTTIQTIIDCSSIRVTPEAIKAIEGMKTFF